MSYCAGCGKGIWPIEAVRVGRLLFHVACRAQIEKPILPVVKPTPVKHINEHQSYVLESKLKKKIHDLRLEIQDTEAMLSSINYPPLVIVK